MKKSVDFVPLCGYSYSGGEKGMFGITADNTKIKAFERDLKELNEKGIPFATRDTLNKTVFFAMRTGRAIVGRKMIQRNKWTVGSVRAEPTRERAIRRQETAFGSTEGYMEVQEFGGVERGAGKHGVPIPTSTAAGQSENQRPRTRMVRRSNRLVNIKIKRFVGSGINRAQRNVRVVQEAVKTGRRYVFLDIGEKNRRRGIFKVVGGRKTFKRGWPPGARLKMIHDLTHKTVRIPKTPWMSPTTRKAVARMPGFYEQALIKQLARVRKY
jgi:hypothetical protein